LHVVPLGAVLSGIKPLLHRADLTKPNKPNLLPPPSDGTTSWAPEAPRPPPALAPAAAAEGGAAAAPREGADPRPDRARVAHLTLTRLDPGHFDTSKNKREACRKQPALANVRSPRSTAQLHTQVERHEISLRRRQEVKISHGHDLRISRGSAITDVRVELTCTVGFRDLVHPRTCITTVRRKTVLANSGPLRRRHALLAPLASSSHTLGKTTMVSLGLGMP
jgi:hypothetical protein